MSKYFEEVKKNFGFGCMRLPRIEEEIDFEQFNEMIDTFIENGFNYFDTAHGYIEGRSEKALRKCLVDRYPRDAYILANKLSNHHYNSQEEILPLFESQLEICGVDYFDFYLMHALNATSFEKYKKCKAFETALELKEQGRIKHLAISFHDKADVLDKILTQYPQIEAVQIQFNYLDYEDKDVESRKCYEVCRKHDTPVIIMEPVKGGTLAAKLPDEAKKVFEDLNGGSPASYAIRYAAGFEGVFMVLSGMGSMEMMNDNISYMKDFKPLNKEELEAIDKVVDIFNSQKLIPCTACKYCMEKCPMNIPIPELFTSMNKRDLYEYSKDEGRVEDCIDCGACEEICPQNIEIRKHLKEAAKFIDE